MTYAPPMHALTGPERYGLVAEGRCAHTVVVGDLVRDAAGALWVFVAMGSDRAPVLEAPPDDVRRATNRRPRRQAGRRLDAWRGRHESAVRRAGVAADVVALGAP